MIHQPLGGAQGQVSDMVIMTEEAVKTKEKINSLIVQHTGQTIEQVNKDTDRNRFMSPEEAKAYGLIDKIYDVKRAEKK
jgi:ATP-dependent Clp protease protease subunit